MKDYSYIFNAHPSYIDSMYIQYKDTPDSVDAGWRTFFEGFDFANRNGQAEELVKPSKGFNPREFQVIGLINGYRRRGHLLSKTNPIKDRVDRQAMLDLADYDLTEKDLDSVFFAGNEIGMGNATLRDIINRLHKIYCGSIGMEYFYISEKPRRRWLRQQLERFNDDDYGLSLDKKRRILEKLNGAVVFEKFLHTKYVGQKRFSIEGGETAIPALDAIINKGAEKGVEEIIIGMAHRGRLNILANIMGKTYEQIFNEFEGIADPDLTMGDGDVKYHLGFSSQIDTPSGKKVHVKLVPNPSHLEAVNTVVEGFARAKVDILYNGDYDKILPILIHGDAAIAGQGIVYETVQMSKLDAYKTGGTIHFVINNQIGFTTDFEDARSAHYCTSVASMVEAPVIHVNGDDPEAVVFACRLAMEYRQKFNSDFFIDMVCYRRHGHNEGDDPKFTQPEMYKYIDSHENPRDIYSKYLQTKGQIESDLAEKMNTDFWGELQERLDSVKQNPLPYSYQEPEMAWKSLKRFTTEEDFEISPDTGVNKDQLIKIREHLMTLPSKFTPLRKVHRLLKSKRKLINKNQYDWALAELMAYGSILLEGHDIRMSGQDVKRGTFSHRHAVLHDTETYTEYNRLNHMDSEQGEYKIFNSFLSEYGVLGFEFGYSIATPNSLVIWEAQFGDFYNGAQIMIDQFITSSESKWRRMSGLVMLLPHGYAGQGPEHSSARLERFLQACAEFNITVANVTTPSNFFHLMRRQLARPFRKPLIVMSPKSLLRHAKCVSPLEEFLQGSRFQETFDDPAIGDDAKKIEKVKTVLCCSGKVYYDLLAHKEEHKRDDVAIVRLEQLYPFPRTQVNAVRIKYAEAQFKWVQEEPSNMGAWQYILSFYRKYDLKLVARKSSASPSTGYNKIHLKQQADIVKRAFEE